VFRALGFVADKDILEHICYDFSDTQMMELLRPSLEEAFVIQNQQVGYANFVYYMLAATVILEFIIFFMRFLLSPSPFQSLTCLLAQAQIIRLFFFFTFCHPIWWSLLFPYSTINFSLIYIYYIIFCLTVLNFIFFHLFCSRMFISF